MTGKRDKFTDLYMKQVGFQKTIENVNVAPYDDPVLFQYHMTSMVEELGEMLKADKRWKTHRNNRFEKHEKLDELADCFITLMNIGLWSGFDSNDVLDAVSRKIDENIRRIGDA